MNKKSLACLTLILFCAQHIGCAAQDLGYYMLSTDEHEFSGPATYIQDALYRRLHTTLKYPTEGVLSVAFNHDGNKVIIGSAGETASILNAQTGEILQSLPGHNGVDAVAFNPTGDSVITTSFDHNLRIWNALTGQLLHTLQGHSGLITSVAFSPCGKFVISGSEDETARVWHAQTGELMHILELGEPATSVTFNHESNAVFTGLSDGTVYRWKADPKELLFLPICCSGSARLISLSPDSRYMLGASIDTAFLYDTIDEKILHTFGDYSYILSAHFCNKGDTVLLASEDGTISFWDTKTGKSLRTLKKYMASITALAFSPDDNFMVNVSGEDQTAYISPVLPAIEQLQDKAALQFLIAAGADWCKGNPHVCDINNPVYKKLINMFSILKDKRLFVAE